MLEAKIEGYHTIELLAKIAEGFNTEGYEFFYGNPDFELYRTQIIKRTLQTMLEDPIKEGPLTREVPIEALLPTTVENMMLWLREPIGYFKDQPTSPELVESIKEFYKESLIDSNNYLNVNLQFLMTRLNGNPENLEKMYDTSQISYLINILRQKSEKEENLFVSKKIQESYTNIRRFLSAREK